MMTRQQAWRRLLLILVVFSLLAFAHSFFLPLHEAPDEQAHFRYIRFIVEHGRLPLTFEERAAADYRANQPALYHSLVALLSGWSSVAPPPALKFVWQSPRFDLVRELLDTKRLANTEDELFPFQGVVWTWHLSRLVGIALSMGTIVVIFLTTLEIIPQNYWLALVASAIVAFLPIFIFISSALSDDSLLGLLTGLFFWALVKIIKGDNRVRMYIWLGLLMGLAVTTKNSAIILPIEVLVFFAGLAWRQGWRWLDWLKSVMIVAAASMVASSWWYATIIIYFNDIETFGPVIGILKPLLASGVNASERYVAYVLSGGAIGVKESAEFLAEPWSAWALNIYQTFWVKDIVDFPLGPTAQVLAGIVCVVAAIGLVRMWRQQPSKRVWVLLLLGHLTLFFIFPAVRHALQGNVSQTGQGRHVLFPTVVAFPLLLVYGWQGWLPAKMQRRLALALVGGLLCWSLVQLVRVIDYPLLYLPVRTTAEAATNIPHRLDQTFGDNLDLLGYDLNINPADDALNLKLYWHSQDYVDEDYRMTVILAQNNDARFTWSSYPINGRYPTRIWESWETIRDDISLPLVDVPPGHYQLQLQLFGLNGPLPVNQANALTLTDVLIQPSSPLPPPQIPLTAAVDGRVAVEGVSLWQAERYTRWQLPEYRPRMQIAFTWQGQPAPDERVEWLLVAPDGQVYTDTPVSAHFAYFPVGLDWPSGDYRLRMELWRGQTVTASEESEPLVTVINKTPRLLEPPPMTHPVEANFAGQIKLLGYDLPARSLSTGQGVPITLYWQGLRTMGADYTVFAKLLDSRQQLWGSAERFPADGYHTFNWLESEIVIDGFELPVDPNPPPGVYWLNLGLYEEHNGSAVSLPLVADGQPAGETSVTFGPIKIGGPPPGAVVQKSQPENAVNAIFGEQIELLGYDVAGSTLNLELTLYWQAVAQPDAAYSTFVHIRNRAGETVTQKDGPTGNGVYPTILWDTGETIADKILMTLPPDLPSGQYSVVVGLYNFATGQRLSVTGTVDDSLELAVVEIP